MAVAIHDVVALDRHSLVIEHDQEDSTYRLSVEPAQRGMQRVTQTILKRPFFAQRFLSGRVKRDDFRKAGVWHDAGGGSNFGSDEMLAHHSGASAASKYGFLDRLEENQLTGALLHGVVIDRACV